MLWSSVMFFVSMKLSLIHISWVNMQIQYMYCCNIYTYMLLNSINVDYHTPTCFSYSMTPQVSRAIWHSPVSVFQGFIMKTDMIMCIFEQGMMRIQSKHKQQNRQCWRLNCGLIWINMIPVLTNTCILKFQDFTDLLTINRFHKKETVAEL